MKRALIALCLLALPAQAQDDVAEERRAPVGARFAGIGGGVVLSQAAHGALEGDVDKVSDAFGQPLSPEFLVHLGLFDASLRASGAVVNRLPGQGTVGNALKSNLALAGALTVASAVQVDLNGFTAGDAVSGEFDKLSDASLGLRSVDPQDLGITLGAFMAAQPVWSGIKRAAGFFGKRLATRFLKTAAVKGALAVAPVPGSRVVALALTLGDVALAAVDLAGLLVVGQAIERPARELNDERRADNEVEARGKALVDAAARGDPDAVETALAATGRAFDKQRNLAFLPVASDDLALASRLRRDGEDPQRLEQIAQQVVDDYGLRLALPAQTRALLDEYEARVAAARAGEDVTIPGDDVEAFAAALERHRERQIERLADALADRAAYYDAEREFYTQLRDRSDDPGVKAKLEAALYELDALADVEADLLRFETPAAAGDERGMTATLEAHLGD